MFYKVLDLACYDLYKNHVKLVILGHDIRMGVICDDLELLTWFLINACFGFCHKMIM